MSQKFLLIFCVCYRFINGDVLYKINKIIRNLQPPYLYMNNNSFPSAETTTEFFLPEIIVNRNVFPDENIDYFPQQTNTGDEYSNLQNYYVPPYPENNLPEIIINDVPPLSNAYLPPAPETITQASEYEPSWNGYNENNINDTSIRYLPPTDMQTMDEPINIPIPPSGNYIPPVHAKKDRKLKDNAARINPPLLVELNELRCLPNQNGYFKALLTVKNSIVHPPIIEHDSKDRRCRLLYSQSKVEVNIPVEQFQLCQVIECGDNGQYLCVQIRFPQIAGMRSLTDAILTLQCKTQNRVVTKTHALRLGVSKERFLLTENYVLLSLCLNLVLSFIPSI